MTRDVVRTVAGRGRAAFAVRGSEFVGYAIPVASEAEAEEAIEAIRSSHEDATHVVPAVRVRDDPDGVLREWSSDAGEPTGSAGKPVLTVLARRGVEGVAVAVVRYFGGTELGVGGLARAYARAASEAIDDAGIEERPPISRVGIAVAYDDSGTVRGLLEAAGVAFEASYEERVSFSVDVPVDAREGLLDRIRSATSGRAEISASDGDGS